MLKQISCDIFKERDKLRPPIVFHRGLNTILGAIRGGAGSIGKSTMMLIIDFAYGGNAYVASDAVRVLPDHAIYFTFEFNGDEYSFERRTDDPKTVINLGENGEVLTTLKIREFTKWLASQYDMELSGASFRQMLSRFFRIYGKNNHNELKPLQTRGGEESQKDAIQILIALFQYYDTIKDFKGQLQKAEEMIAAFKAARRYEFIPSAVDGMTKYRQNTVEIASLEQERHKLEESDDSAVDPSEVKKANTKNELGRQLADIRRAIKNLRDEVHLLDLNIRYGAYPTEADLKSLQEFFPQANLAKLVEIEKFHMKIQSILSEELAEANKSVLSELKALESQEAQILSQMDTIPTSKVFTQEFLDTYTSLDRRIAKLKDENDAFDRRNKLQTQKRAAYKRYQKQLKNVLASIEIAINSQMEAINDEITGGEYNAPSLTINAFNSYNFETPKDKGTGTNHRSMIIYDLAVLQNTVLPAIAHDSIVFDSIPRPDLSNLIRVYNDQVEKQIFIAVDKVSDCTDEAKAIIKQTMVLKLDNNEQALFGEKWSRKDRS